MFIAGIGRNVRPPLGGPCPSLFQANNNAWLHFREHMALVRRELEVWQFVVALLAGAEIGDFAKHQKLSGREGWFTPAHGLRFTQLAARSGGKPPFPT